MANSSINLVDLDFNALKASFKEYAASQARFRDYNFDGSNINVLLDVLAYNSYLNTFYLNMVASEMFLDTAQLRDSVVSHAKELNYLPRSFRSAYANVNIVIAPSTNTVSTVVIPAKTSFTSRVGSNTFNFTVRDSISISTSNNGVFYANNILLYEGGYVTDSFVKNAAISNQRFVLTNPNIDTSSIEISIRENSGANVSLYTQSFSMFDVGSTSNVFFVQAAENEQYEIVFGDGVSGRSPKDGSVIDVTYRTSSGELPNNADTFINNSSIDGHANVRVILNSAAINGAVSEDIAAIKFNAPRSFQTQERAVTENDYKTLLTREFPEIQAIGVYGGEKSDPPQYGTVFIAVDVTNADGVPDFNKNQYRSYLSDKVPLGITVSIVDPLFIYLSADITVKYDYNSTTLSSEQLKTNVLSAVTVFNDLYLNDFNSKFRYSNFVCAIDEVDSSVINNDTTVVPYFLLNPVLSADNEFDLSYGAEILVTSPIDTTHSITTEKGVYSTQFVYAGKNCVIEDDGDGNIRIVEITVSSHREVAKIGTVDYTSGVVIISNLNVESYSGNGIKLYAKPVGLDFQSSPRHILKIDNTTVNINIIPDRR